MNSRMKAVIGAFVGILILAGCDGDNTNISTPAEAKKWLAEHGYTVDGDGIDLAMKNRDLEAIQVFVLSEGQSKRNSARAFVLGVGRCVDRVPPRNGSWLSAKECWEYAQAFLRGGIDKQVRIDFGDTIFSEMREQLASAAAGASVNTTAIAELQRHLTSDD